VLFVIFLLRGHQPVWQARLPPTLVWSRPPPFPAPRTERPAPHHQHRLAARIAAEARHEVIHAAACAPPHHGLRARPGAAGLHAAPQRRLRTLRLVLQLRMRFARSPHLRPRQHPARSFPLEAAAAAASSPIGGAASAASAAAFAAAAASAAASQQPPQPSSSLRGSQSSSARRAATGFRDADGDGHCCTFLAGSVAPRARGRPREGARARAPARGPSRDR
jgi:hypothetical protein